MEFIQVQNKLRVVHYPQVGCDKSFIVEVKNEEEAFLITNTLANQHLWLHENKFIPDYANVILVELFDTDIDEESETGEPYGWVDYFNESIGEWDDVEEYFQSLK